MKVLAIGLLMLMPLYGCIELSKEIEKGVLEIRVGDVPTEDFRHINITFSQIKVHKKGNESGWINITTDEKTIDLLHLHMNNITETLGLKELDVGNYTKIWIVVSRAVGILNETGKNVTFDVPSEDIKIQQSIEIKAGKKTVVTVDINLEKSILVVGNVYKFLPVISFVEVKHPDGNKTKIENPKIENRRPIIDLVINGERAMHVTIYAGENITFDATNSFDPDGDNLTIYWEFGDGTNATGGIVNHSYMNPGMYHGKLYASDGKIDVIKQFTVNVIHK